MSVQVETDRVFDGLVYAKERQKTCQSDIINSTTFQLTMPLDGTICNTLDNGHGTYSNYIMIQYNDKIVTSKDMGLSVSCEYDLGSRNVTGILNTNG
jgi:Zona pellucida-like domain